MEGQITFKQLTSKYIYGVSVRQNPYLWSSLDLWCRKSGASEGFWARPVLEDKCAEGSRVQMLGIQQGGSYYILQPML